MGSQHWQRRKWIDWTRGSPVDWTRRPASSLERDAADQLKNALILGRPGAGKSTAVLKDIVEVCVAGREACVCADFHGQTHDAVLPHLLARGLESRIEVLDLAYPESVFGLEVQPYSEAALESVRRLEDDRSVENFIQVLGRELNFNPNTSPLKGTWARNALRLRQRQRQRKPLRLVPYGLLFGHPLQRQLLDGCFDERLLWEFETVARMRSIIQREAIVSPAKRFFEPFFENPVVDGMLSGDPIPLRQWLREKKIILVRSSGLVSETASRGVIGALFLRVMHEAALEFAETGKPLPVRVFLEEFQRLQPGALEADQLSQCRKWGVGVVMIVQRLTEELKPILDVVQQLQIFALGSDEAADFASRQVGTFLLDNQKVKDRQFRERTVNRGVKREIIKTNATRKDKDGNKDGETTSEHVLSTPELETVYDEVKLFDPLGDQYLMTKQAIRRIDIGERFVVNGNGVRGPEKVIPLVQLWTNESLRKTRVAEALERIRSRPHYFTPDLAPPSAESVIEDEPSPLDELLDDGTES